MEYVADNTDLFAEYEAERERKRRCLERLAREERIAETKLDQKMYEKWETKGGKYEFV